MWFETGRISGLLFVASVIGVLVTGSCGGGGETVSSPEPTDPGSTGSDEPVVITIGSLTDLTGPAADGMSVVDMALDDMVRYYNEEGLIPGVKLEVLKYDTQIDLARHASGYEWLLENGADLIWGASPIAPAALKDRLDADQVVMLSPEVDLNDLAASEHLFCVGIVPQMDAWTLLAWIAGNDWDYEANGPAKIGGAGWDDVNSPGLLSAAEQYCNAHPDQFEWVAGYLTQYKFSWTDEVQKLKDCDYVFVPTLMAPFVKQYREVGGAGTLLADDASLAFMSHVRDGDLWEQFDGLLGIRSSRWWNESGEQIDLVKALLTKYRPDSAQAIMNRGSGYLGATHARILVEIVRKAADAHGAAGVDRNTLYAAAQQMSLALDGLEVYTFDETKRYATNYYRVYELSAAEKDLVVVADEWYPTRTGP